MRHVSERKEPPLPLSCLRLLVPPLRLASAAIWHTVQQKVVADYGLLDDFVTTVSQIVPELLNQRQRSLLSLGLRAQLILELCRPEQTIDLKAIQPHLHIMQTVTSLWKTETSESSGSNILGLIQTLIKDQDERQHFFQDVFPVTFGQKYNEDIQMLVETFLLQLEKLLIVPNLQQVTSMLNVDDVSSALAECVECFSHPRELSSLLEYQKDIIQPNDHDNRTIGGSICTALCLPPMATVSTDQEETVLKSNVLTEYMDSFSKELLVETAALNQASGDSSVERDERGKRRETESSCVESRSFDNGEEGVEDESPCTVQHVESLRGDDVGLDSCAVEVQVGCNVEIPAEETGPTESKPSISVIATGEEGHVQLSDGTSADGAKNSTEMEKYIRKESEEARNGTLTGEHMKNIGVPNVMTSLYTPATQVLKPEPIVTPSPRPVRLNRGQKMKTFLMMTTKSEQCKCEPRTSSTSKTCPTCGKTYSRASDMRRHQRSHSGERPFQCSQCKKLFQFQYDLKRHEFNVCRITVPPPRQVSSETPEEKNTGDPNRGDVADQPTAQPTKRSIDVKTHIVAPVIAPYRCSNCDGTFQCAQRLRTHEKACLGNPQQAGAPSGERVPPATVRDPQPSSSHVQLADTEQQNQSLLEDDNSAAVHQENTGEGVEPEVGVRTPHGNTCEGRQECTFSGKSIAFPSFLERRTEIPSEKWPRHCAVCNKGYKSIASMKRHSGRCEGSSVHGDDVKGQKSSSASPGELAESTPAGGHQFSHNSHIPGNTEAIESDCSKVCHMGSRLEDSPNFEFKTGLKRRTMTACKVKRTYGGESDAIHQGGRNPKQGRKGFQSTKTPGKHKLADHKRHCAECNRSFPDVAKLQAHSLRHKSRPCTMCEESFKGFIDLNRHYGTAHNFSGPFSCTFCERTYSDLRGLIRHERFHTGDLPFKCPKCPKAFSYASALKLHDRSHTKEAPFLCWDCGKGCKSNATLKTHRLCCHSSAEEKRFCCEHCGKAYALKRSLDLHVAKLHAGVRYPCAHCGKLFRSASSLTRHDLTHTQERPYSCSGCGKSFRSASELKIHTRYHTGERPFKCQECGKGFVQSYYLTAHTRMHTGERPYTCPTCEKCFKSAGILKRHQMTHTGEKPHKCSVCEMAFSRPELMKAHVRKSHKTLAVQSL